MLSPAEAVRALQPVDAESASYLDYHRRRYVCLLELAGRVWRTQTGPARILDVGMSYQTVLLRRLFPEADLTSLGFRDMRFEPLERLTHIEFNLNDSVHEAAWPRADAFDLIVMAEVIEHLYVPPARVLRMLRGLLRPGGSLVLQTPNPVNLARRLTMLVGKSPFHIIREELNNPGHFCEYTVEQLRYLAGITGLEVTAFELRNYFGESKPTYDFCCRLLPGRLHEGISMVLRRPYEFSPAG
ncbi:MAG: class I SAM-dependent methyltransferase [Acidobacteria bacterium]|nr:class I SAM-dependent methyltransferase [Acidobacteriota bacterium]